MVINVCLIFFYSIEILLIAIQAATPLPMMVTFKSLQFQQVKFIRKNIPAHFYGHLWNGTIAMGIVEMAKRLYKAYPEVAPPESGDDDLDGRFQYMRFEVRLLC